ncbi:hypothetical protein COLO4_15018 [Corchorus olitorius]|uniref:DC1 domain-containing protein n=1 Tax=Corchorus olitorius TaxID=93759 RepID=A0A1R3JPU6_9ROSI|nr:hypothetical protein COLO4_15018 [Corchorus olitorius]
MNTIKITGVTHSSHRQHELKWVRSHSPYICNGCNDFGSGPRFSCPNRGCNFNLHGDCCKISDHNHVTNHPFLNGSNSNFVLRNSSNRTGSEVKCNACKDYIGRGSDYYHCDNTKRNLHRSCASIPSTITKNINNKEVTMTLKQRFETTCSYPGCPSVKGGWSYFSSDDRISLHVKCWKYREMKKLNPPDVTQLKIR